MPKVTIKDISKALLNGDKVVKATGEVSPFGLGIKYANP